MVFNSCIKFHCVDKLSVLIMVMLAAVTNKTYIVSVLTTITTEFSQCKTNNCVPSRLVFCMWSTRDPGSLYCVALLLVLQRQVQSAGSCPQLRQPKMSRHCPMAPEVRIAPITVLADHSEASPLCGALWHPLTPHCPLLPPASL